MLIEKFIDISLIYNEFYIQYFLFGSERFYNLLNSIDNYKIKNIFLIYQYIFKHL